SLSASPVAQSEDDLYRLPQPHMLKGNNFRMRRHSAKDGYKVPERRISGVAAKSFRVWAANCQGESCLEQPDSETEFSNACYGPPGRVAWELGRHLTTCVCETLR